MIENPVGYLCCRPYMQVIPVPHRLVRMDFRGRYMKPTHLWTNIMWTPRGTTGKGLCCCKCKGGGWSEKGKWRHKYALARRSWRAAAGKGRMVMKAEVPRMLHKEMLRSRLKLMC